MKKRFIFLLLIILIAICVVSGVNAAKDTVYLAMGTGSTGGSYYIWTNAIISMINEKSDYIEASPESVSGSAHTIRLVDKQQLDFGAPMTDMTYYGWRGTREFENKYQNVRVAYAFPRSGQCAVTTPDSPINSIYDLKGKLITVNSSSGEAKFKSYMEQAGLYLDKGDYKTRILTYNEGAMALKDGTVDASLQLAYPPGGSFIDLKSTVGVKVIYFPEDVVNKVIAEYSFWPKNFVPKDVVAGTDEEYESKIPFKGIMGGIGSIIVNKDVPDEVVYDVVRLIYENTDELEKIHYSLGTLDYDYIQEFITANTPSIPWHPGALKYFEEIGMEIPTHVLEENFTF